MRENEVASSYTLEMKICMAKQLKMTCSGSSRNICISLNFTTNYIGDLC